MTSLNPHDWVFVFDLDDTLFNEVDFVHSAYQHLAKILNDKLNLNLHSQLPWQENLKDSLVDKILALPQVADHFSKEDLLEIYRQHPPQISLTEETKDILAKIKNNFFAVGIITDGRSITQRNKIKALDLGWIQNILVSEETGFKKPDSRCFTYFEEEFPGKKYIYVADNPRKDFVTPNEKGWLTFGLRDKGRNIHSQEVSVPTVYLPQTWIVSLEETLQQFLIKS